MPFVKQGELYDAEQLTSKEIEEVLQGLHPDKDFLLPVDLVLQHKEPAKVWRALLKRKKEEEKAQKQAVPKPEPKPVKRVVEYKGALSEELRRKRLELKEKELELKAEHNTRVLKKLTDIENVLLEILNILKERR